MQISSTAKRPLIRISDNFLNEFCFYVHEGVYMCRLGKKTKRLKETGTFRKKKDVVLQNSRGNSNFSRISADNSKQFSFYLNFYRKSSQQNVDLFLSPQSYSRVRLIITSSSRVVVAEQKPSITVQCNFWHRMIV